MQDDRELNVDELSAVHGGMASTGGGLNPKPSPVEEFVKWLISKLA